MTNLTAVSFYHYYDDEAERRSQGIAHVHELINFDFTKI